MEWVTYLHAYRERNKCHHYISQRITSAFQFQSHQLLVIPPVSSGVSFIVTKWT